MSLCDQVHFKARKFLDQFHFETNPQIAASPKVPKSHPLNAVSLSKIIIPSFT
jgi:hypothetical protein